MRVNRATLSALGTTGVLLAASLTMLALVSALVTFDAWPSRSGAAYASPIAVHGAPTPRVVRAVLRPTSVAARSRARATSLAAAARRAGAFGAVGPTTGSSSGGPGPSYVSAPVSYAQQPVPGGPGQGPPPIVIPPSPQAPSPASEVHAVACTAAGTVSGVNGAAGAAVGSVC
jgi:hypothetical protein